MKRETREKRMERKIVELLKSGKSQNEIVKILGVGDRRVRRIRKMAETWGYIGTESPIPTRRNTRIHIPKDSN